MATINIDAKCDLNKPVVVRHLDGMVFSQDVKANMIRVSVFRNREPVDLSGGSVSANIIRADGATVVQTGTIEGNVCSVVLPSSAYAVPGQIAIFVKHSTSAGPTTSTIAAITGYVYKSTTDTIVDPGSVVPNVNQLLAMIEDCEEATEACIAATTAAPVVDDTAGEGDTNRVWSASKVSALKTEVDSMNTAFDINVSPNGFNGNLTPGYINTTGAFADNADYAYTDMIPVQASTFVATGSSISNGRRMTVPLRFITAYDANKAVLSAYGQQRVGEDSHYIDTDGATIVTLDPSVKYVVLSIYKPTAKYTDICVSFNTTITDYIPYGTTVTLNEDALPDVKYTTLHKFLNGKTIAVFGDSIMYGAGSDSKGAADMLAEKYGMTVAKYCVSGSTMGVRTDDPRYTVDEVHHIAKQVRNAIAAEITPDIIIFNGGTNDIGGGITIGEMTKVYTQPATEAYFADGFETVAYLLKKNFVGVPMVYLRAHNMSSRSYDGQKEYGELGNQIAEKWGIRTVDMYKRMNTQLEEYRTAYLADYTHPNTAGYNKYYIPALEEFIFNEVIN